MHAYASVAHSTVLQSTRRWWLVGALQAEALALVTFPAGEAMADRYALIAAVPEAAASTASVGVRRRVLQAPGFHTSICSIKDLYFFLKKKKRQMFDACKHKVLAMYLSFLHEKAIMLVAS